MQFSFGLTRLMIAVAIFAAAMAFGRSLGTEDVIVSLVIAIPSGCLALLAQRRHVRPILRSLVWTGAGAILGMLFCPTVDPPYEPGDEFRYAIGGAIVGWMIGAVKGEIVGRPA